MHGGHLAVNVGREVICQQVVVAAGGDGLDQGLEEVFPAKGAAAYQVCCILEAWVQLQSHADRHQHQALLTSDRQKATKCNAWLQQVLKR